MRCNAWPNDVMGLATLGLALVLYGAAPSAAENADRNGLTERLLESVRKDDDAAYRRARDEALRLPADDFAALLRSLDKLDTWQAMAIHDGVKLRREQPDVAADFDDRLKEAIDNPGRCPRGTLLYWLHPSEQPWKVRGLLLTPEHDTLRFEASLTPKTQVRDGARDSLRSRLIQLSQRDEHSLRRYVALIADEPKWVRTGNIHPSEHVEAIAARSPGMINPKVPRLVDIYKSLRHDDAAVGIAMLLVRAIAHGSPEVNAPALMELRRHELDTMPKQGLQPWAVRNVERLREEVRENTVAISRLQHELRALPRRGEGEEAIEPLERKLAAMEQQLQRDRKILAAVRLWQTLEDAIAETEAPPPDGGKHRK